MLTFGGDHGGASYGAYQLSSKAGALREYLDQSVYGPKFAGLAVGSPAFDAEWRNLARTDPGFAADQHQFIGRSHYGQQVDRLRARGLDIWGRGPAVQDCVWSTAVQMRNMTPRVFERGVKEAFGPHVDIRTLSDRQIVEAVQEYKIRHNSEIFSRSPTLWNGLLRRANAERLDLVKLADAGMLAPHLKTSANRTKPEHDASEPHSQRPARPTKAPEPHALDRNLAHAQVVLTHLGYTGADGRLLHIDGRSGPNSRHAISQFQRDHGLQPTGRLDADSIARLDAADRTLASSSHPAHALYRQSLSAIYELEAQLGIPHGRHSLALAGQAAVEAARAGLTRVDRVEVGSDRRFAQAVEFRAGIDFGPTNRISSPMNITHALTQSLEASSEQAAKAMNARPAQPASQEHRPVRAPLL